MSVNEIVAREVHRPYRRGERRKVLVPHLGHTFSADLAYMRHLKTVNDGFEYILTVIDIWSRYAWAFALKDKEGETIKEAFEKIFSEKLVPRKLWTDRGSEFYNATFKTFLATKRVTLYSTGGEGKAVVIERFNKTLKNMMYKRFTELDQDVWIHDLDALVKKYNNTVHSSIGEKPIDVWEERVFLPPNDDYTNQGKPKYRIGDVVRIPFEKNKFTRGFTPQWSYELFTISKVHTTIPFTYSITDWKGEEIIGGFYEWQLLKTEQDPNELLIDHRRKKTYGRGANKGKVKVHYLGYEDRISDWIPRSED